MKFLEELVNKFKSLKPYQYEPDKEVMTDSDESEQDSEESDNCSQILATKNVFGMCFVKECALRKNRERNCLCCQKVAALNEKLVKSAVTVHN